MNITTDNTVSSKALYCYYGLLLLIMCMWTNTISAAPQLLRLFFLIAVVFPLFAYRKSWTPIILSLFLIISGNSFATSVLPTGEYIYYTIIVVLLLSARKINCLKSQPLTLFLLLYALFVNFVTENTIGMAGLYRSLFFLYAFSYFVRKDDLNYPHKFSYVFVISSLALSLLLLIFRDQFVEEVGDYETYTWKDTNYFCAVIAMGVVAAFIELFRPSTTQNHHRVFLIIVAVIDLLVILLSASRGALLDVAVGFLVLFLFTKVKKWVKILVVASIVIFVYFSYNAGVLDFVLYRLTEEGSMDTGTGRTEIWLYKLLLFFQESPASQIFGLGCEGGRALGANGSIAGYVGLMSTHNDFLSFLLYYGYIGFVAFLVLLFRPLAMSHKKPVVLSGTLFLVCSCFTIEPFAGGNIAWYAFLFYIYIWSQVPNEQIVK